MVRRSALARPGGDMTWMESMLRMPELGLLLAVGLGPWMGGLRLFESFSLGTVTAALLMGLVIGNVWKEPSHDLRSAFFLLFLFGNGYSVGPQFASALRQSGAKPLVISFIVVLTGLVASLVMSRALGLSAGVAAGLYSGAMTASAAMGTAIDTINGAGLAPDAAAMLANQVVVTDALTYVFGAIGVIIFVSTIAPWLMGKSISGQLRRRSRQVWASQRSRPAFSPPASASPPALTASSPGHFSTGGTLRRLRNWNRVRQSLSRASGV